MVTLMLALGLAAAAPAAAAENAYPKAAAAYVVARSPLSPAIFRLREASLVPEVVS